MACDDGIESVRISDHKVRNLVRSRGSVPALALRPHTTDEIAFADIKSIGLLDDRTGKLVRPLISNDGAACEALTWNPQGTVLAARHLGVEALWDMSTNAVTDLQDHRYTSDDGPPNATSDAWTRGGSAITVGLMYKVVEWRLGQSQRKTTILNDQSIGIVGALAYNPQRHILAIGWYGGNNEAAGLIFLREPKNVLAHKLHFKVSTNQHDPAPQSPSIQSLQWNSTGDRLAVMGNRAGIWDMRQNRYLRLGSNSTNDTNVGAWSPDGKLLAEDSPDGAVCIWRGSTGRLVRVLPPHKAGIAAIAWRPVGSEVAVLYADGYLEIANI